eukprot:972370-Rhodomonas_salina.1
MLLPGVGSLARLCPLLLGMPLRSSYAMSGTGLAYRASSLPARYAMSGTDGAYAAARYCARPGTIISTKAPSVPRVCYAMPGTETGCCDPQETAGAHLTMAGLELRRLTVAGWSPGGEVEGGGEEDVEW